MEVSDWHFAQKFEELRQRALRFGIERQAVVNDKSAPFIEWTGNTEYLGWLCDSSREPPLDVVSIKRSQPLEEFFCWLMLPKSFDSDKWYFGRVFTQRRSLSEELRAFRAIASEAGKLLRSDSLFRNYLSPCIAHVEFASRFSAFHDHLDESYWCALLFTRPTLSHPIKFPFKKSIAGEEIGVASIANPFKLTAELIANWRLNSESPVQAVGHVARPYQWPRPTPVTATTLGVEQHPPKPVRRQNVQKMQGSERSFKIARKPVTLSPVCANLLNGFIELFESGEPATPANLMSKLSPRYNDNRKRFEDDKRRLNVALKEAGIPKWLYVVGDVLQLCKLPKTSPAKTVKKNVKKTSRRR